MATPMYHIRIIRGRGELPHNLDIVMPGPTPTKHRKDNTFYIEDHLPQDDERHICLGKFVNAWGYLETNVLFLFTTLLGTDHQASKSVFNGLGMRQVIDSIRALSSIRLDDETNVELEKLLSRLIRLNSKRNTIIHGHWILEVFTYVWNGVPKINVHLFRSVDPTDERIAEKINDPRNQRERIKFNYTLERINAVTRDAENLTLDIENLNRKLSGT